jgi:hypothetical protein
MKITALLACLTEYVDAVEEALTQTEVGRNASPRYAERLHDAGEALKAALLASTAWREPRQSGPPRPATATRSTLPCKVIP